MKYWSRLAALLVAILVFDITLIPKHDAFGVLYVFVVVIVADSCTTRVLPLLAGACIILECIAVFVKYYKDPRDEVYARLALSIVAIIVGTILVIRNKKARESLSRHLSMLAHADRLASLGHLSASIAHEVNQPLSAITTFSQAGRRWLMRDEPDVAEALLCFEDIGVNVTRAANIVKHARNLTRKDPGRRVLVDPNEVIDETISFLRFEISSNKIEIQKIARSGQLEIFADRIQIQQVFMNIMMNAIEALRLVSDRKKIVHITLYNSEKKMITIKISDTGKGFCPLSPDLLFEPFVTTRSGGTGMGLAICRSIVELHGGKIEARDIEPWGAVVIVRLPVAGEER